MASVQLTRKYLMNPVYGIGVLLVIALTMEGVAWSYMPTSRMARLEAFGGIMPYVSMVIRSIILPELVTVVILLNLLNQQHQFLNIKSISISPKALLVYQIQLLPIILLAFFVFNPVTETVRFLLEKFPNYSLNNYISSFLVGTFSTEMYLRYIIPVFVIGYGSVNISLLSDYLAAREKAQQAAEAESALIAQAITQLSINGAAMATSPENVIHLKGKNTLGEISFPATEAFYFTVEERAYYAELPKGRYQVAKTLNELETELDTTQFFRIKRDYIVNREAILNFAYWENGKYIVRLSTPDSHEIIVPRARMHEFREWLQGIKPGGSNPTASSLEMIPS